MLCDYLLELAEKVRETYALRSDPVERGRWIAYSNAYTLLREKLEIFDVDPTLLGLDRDIFKDLPTFP